MAKSDGAAGETDSKHTLASGCNEIIGTVYKSHHDQNNLTAMKQHTERKKNSQQPCSLCSSLQAAHNFRSGAYLRQTAVSVTFTTNEIHAENS